MTRHLFLPAVILAGLSGTASAATVTLTDTWQNLGTGPLLLQTQGGDGLFEASATAPTDNGLALGKNQTPFGYLSSLSIWGKRRAPARSNTGAPLATTVTSSPLTLAGGGGGGTGGSVTQGTSPWVDNISQWAGTNVGAPTNYGTAPTGAAPGVNAFVTNFPATQAVSWTGQTVAATQSGAWSVAVNNFPTTQAVSGTVTANQGGAPWAVSWTGQTVAATQSGTWNTNLYVGGAANASGNPAFVQVTNFPATQPVSGTVTANQGGAPWSTTISGTLPAFAAIPAFKIDQTTPGTTNKVSIGSDGIVTLYQGGAALASGNPIFASITNTVTVQGTTNANLYVAGAANSLSNPALVQQVVNGAAASATNPLPVTESAANLATNQASVSTSTGSTAACPARAGRRAVTLQQLGTTAAYFGASGVTNTTGAVLPGSIGSSFTVNTAAAVYAVTATGTTTVACIETY